MSDTTGDEPGEEDRIDARYEETDGERRLTFFLLTGGKRPSPRERRGLRDVEGPTGTDR